MEEQSEQSVPDDPGTEEQMLCPHCMEPVDTISHFCNACGGPISAFSNIDPMGQVYSAGHAYRNATGRPTRFIVVLGVWLIFGPQLFVLAVIGLFSTWSLLAHDRSLGNIHVDGSNQLNSLYALLFCLALALIYLLILYKTTSIYIRGRLRDVNGICFKCGYVLRRRHEQIKCPECGEEIKQPSDCGTTNPQ